MVLQVKDCGAFRHQPSTSWVVTYLLRAPQTPKRKVARETIGTNASKAREKDCEDKEIRSREYKIYKRVVWCFKSKITVLSGTNLALHGS